MAVTITDRRTTVSNAETTTGWTGAGYGTVTDRAEGTYAVGNSLNSSTGQTYFTGTGVNLGTSPGTLVYVYAFNNALQLAWDNSPPPIALLLGDGTDRIAFDMAGTDRRVFNHLEGPTAWQCLVLDTAQASTMNTNGNTYVVSGSFANLNFGSITDWGCSFDTQSKALGGGYNVAVDIIRYGNDGIRLTAGGVGTEGTFAEIAAADRSIASGAGHGILRAYTTIAFGVQGPLTFGDSGTATDCYFEDSGVVVVYEARDIADDKYYLAVEGNSGATNSFVLTGSTVTTAGPHVRLIANAGNVDTLTLTGNTFALGGTVKFSNLADASGHTVTDNTFDGCDEIDPGDVEFKRNTISNSVATTGALLIDADGTANISDLAFTSSGTGHALYITAAGTYTLTGLTYSGYATSDGTTGNEVVYNNSGGAVTLNISGGDAPTVRNGAGASTTVNVSVPVTVTVKDATTLAAIQGARVYLATDPGGTEILNTTTDVNGQVTTAYTATTPQAVTGKVRKASSSPFYKTGIIADTIQSSTGLSLTVLLIGDE